MAKANEYKYKLVVSRTRKVNLGNYESEDVFESLSQGFDNKKDLVGVRQFLISEVTESVAGQVELMIPKKDEKPQAKEFEIDNADEEIDKGSQWPKHLICRICNTLINRKDNTFDEPPFVYECPHCTKKEGKSVRSWPDWYREMKGWKK